jgi:hypothetical protein
MNNIYTWQINALNCIPSENGQNNIVSNIHWNVYGTDSVNQATAYGTQPLKYTAGTPFIDYSNLTQDIVIGWLKDAMGTEQVTSIQTSLDNQLANLANPPIVTPHLPWVKQ